MVCKCVYVFVSVSSFVRQNVRVPSPFTTIFVSYLSFLSNSCSSFSGPY